MAKILIVDDDNVFIRVVQARLEACGYEIVTANDGEEGLEKAEKEKPDLIILDVLMPRMDGNAMLAQVKRNKEIEKIPIIMSSGKVLLNIAADSSRIKADAYLTKPFDPSVFIAAIRELLEKSKFETDGAGETGDHEDYKGKKNKTVIRNRLLNAVMALEELYSDKSIPDDLLKNGVKDLQKVLRVLGANE